jgi:hypothetical protein
MEYQFFAPVNLDKKEYLDPLKIGDGTLFDWCADQQSGLLSFLLRKSSEKGKESIYKDSFDITKDYQTAGRWAGDRVILLGEFDESGLWEKLKKEFKDITEQVVKEYNDFILTEEFQVIMKRVK